MSGINYSPLKPISRNSVIYQTSNFRRILSIQANSSSINIITSTTNNFNCKPSTFSIIKGITHIRTPLSDDFMPNQGDQRLTPDENFSFIVSILYSYRTSLMYLARFGIRLQGKKFRHGWGLVGCPLLHWPPTTASQFADLQYNFRLFYQQGFPTLPHCGQSNQVGDLNLFTMHIVPLTSAIGMFLEAFSFRQCLGNTWSLLCFCGHLALDKRGYTIFL